MTETSAASQGPSPAQVNARLLAEILEQLKQLNQTIDDFTAQGMPLKAQVPSNELIASIAAAVALVSRDNPTIGASDLQGRVDAAQVLGALITRAFDAYQSQTRPDRLSQLLNDR